ncbi:MAG: TolC family outer membrane protein [Alphaproteobacteria bacterium]|nr:TolC family outer membrane protein [Alphaproteobacteria bacterium]
MFKKITYLTILLCGVSNVAMADTLKDVLAYTYENSLMVTAERAGLKAKDETVVQAKSGYRPTIQADASIGKSHNEYTYDNVLGETDYDQTPKDVSISFVQPIFSGLTTYNTVQATKNQVRSGRFNLKNTEQVTLLEATAVYMDVIRDKAVLDLQISNEKVLKKHLESYRKRFKAGELTRTDVAQSEARVSGAVANRIAAEGQLEVSKANFFSVVGIEPKDLQDVDDLSVSLPQTIEQAIDLALKHNPKIRTAHYAEQAALDLVSAKKGKLSPSVDVRGAAGKQKNMTTVKETDYWKVTANLNVPIYQAGAEYAVVREAKQLANQYRILLAKTRQDVRSETTAAWERYQATKAQIQSIKDQIKASKIALEGVIREANVGSRTVLDVLDAEQEHLDNQVNLTRAHREEIVSAFSLLSAIGQMNPDGLKLDVQTYDPQKYYDEVQSKWIGWGIN